MTPTFELNRFTLPNGLRVVHHPDPSSAMVVVNIIYNVGARDESPEKTGVAHLFEHLMFGGSANVPSFDRAIEEAGASNNAWTSNDFTNFYDIIPAHNVETAFWAESDRMSRLTLTPEALAIQQGVVIEEFKQQCLNRPYGDMGHSLRSLNYQVHPYRWPVIGIKPEHIADFTLDNAVRFYESHYAPNNAVLVVGGNITLDRCRELADKWFAPLPSMPIATRDYSPEPLPEAPRQLTVEANVPNTIVTVSFPMSGFADGSFFQADVITDILASGRSARLYTELLNTSDLLTMVDASILGSDEPGLLMVSARLRENRKDHAAKAVELIHESLRRLTRETISTDELNRALNRSISSFTFDNINLARRVASIATREIRGLDINAETPRYRAITPEQIREAAAEILNPDRASTLIYGPQLS